MALDEDFQDSVEQLNGLKETFQMICADAVRRLGAADHDLTTAADEGESQARIDTYRVDLNAARALVDAVTAIVGEYVVQPDLVDNDGEGIVPDENLEPAF